MTAEQRTCPTCGRRIYVEGWVNHCRMHGWQQSSVATIVSESREMVAKVMQERKEAT